MLRVCPDYYVSRLEEGQTKVEPQRLQGVGLKPHILCNLLGSWIDAYYAERWLFT